MPEQEKLPLPEERLLGSTVIAFWLPGVPEPQGSKRGFVNPKTGKAMIVDVQHSRQRSWRREIIDEAQRAYGGPPLNRSLQVDLIFAFERPQGHWNKKGLLRASAPRHMETGKDIDKLARAVLDALKIAGTISDDRRVSKLECTKDYLDAFNFKPVGPGLRVQISERQ